MSRRRTPLAFDRSRAPEQRRTAATWAKRAVRAYRLAAKTRTREALLDAEDHRHEALEHAALASDEGRTVARIERSMTATRAAAWEAAG